MTKLIQETENLSANSDNKENTNKKMRTFGVSTGLNANLNASFNTNLNLNVSFTVDVNDALSIKKLKENLIELSELINLSETKTKDKEGGLVDSLLDLATGDD